ncbi:MAG: hypothetical protein K2X63_06550, partial [Burkholderiaceae bacterium]|nr:hypothetical protein [Burkholderiaceae bacterium]
MRKIDKKSDYSIPKNPKDFSLVLGGFLYRFFVRIHLSGETLQHLTRRIVILSLLAWLPLLLLSGIQGDVLQGNVQLPFLHDIELHVRLLVAMPILIGAELIVHQRVRPIVGAFLDRQLITPGAIPQFEAAIRSAMRWRNSVMIEIIIIGLVYAVGILFIWRTQFSMDIESWYGGMNNEKFHPTLAGWWLMLVSLPMFQFLLLRWYFRIFLWARFLWQVSRIKLNLLFSNPDRCGGLGFLTQTTYAFAPLLFAQGVLLAGMICDRVLYANAKLTDFKFEIIGLVALELFCVLAPLMVFTPQLLETKRNGMLEFGNMMHGAVFDFHMRWFNREHPA